jgi:hypothetical protein
MKHNGICMYNCFNIKYLCILPTECIAGFHILRINRGYFHMPDNSVLWRVRVAPLMNVGSSISYNDLLDTPNKGNATWLPRIQEWRSCNPQPMITQYNLQSTKDFTRYLLFQVSGWNFLCLESSLSLSDSDSLWLGFFLSGILSISDWLSWRRHVENRIEHTFPEGSVAM